MILRKWEDLPDNMKCPEVRKYYDILGKKSVSLIIVRIFDIIVSALMLAFLLPFMLVISIAIIIDSEGSALFLQTRVTQYGREFKIFKFRTMINGSDKASSQLTTNGDLRITKVGKLLRGTRLDELPQLVNILIGDMSFVGTRPEVPKYVEQYQPEMLATLLLPAGVTSEASILYKDEYKLLEKADDVGKIYVEKVLPAKMYYNLNSIKKFSFFQSMKTVFKTVLAVCGKRYYGDYQEKS